MADDSDQEIDFWIVILSNEDEDEEDLVDKKAD